MAGSSLLALIDDIAAVLDDVAVMTKVAAKKTAGVLGDDLALNAEQVSGVRAERELPVVWAVAKGSAKNKLILVPSALLLSVLLPWLITPLLMLGGAYLCYEGFEKVAHKFFHKDDEKEHQEKLEALSDPNVDMEEFEKEKIKGAIRTDFILSAEIIVIALGTVQNAEFMMQVSVVVGIAVLMTVGVYGLVAGIVKLDDAGYYLVKQASSFKKAVGKGLLIFAPFLMKSLSIIGTIAMFMVGGSILLHGIPGSHDFFHGVKETMAAISTVGTALKYIVPTLLEMIGGFIAGGLVLLLVSGVQKVIGKKEAH
ncbi:DUF808 domain-containing protein [Pleionea sp. CnH1-48]|uniref:DUF808 domain-containing protein n=1 Tax=Pleionea sp. CnH1-48 TaxID=2954494 RepID=UPI0020976EDC|nr:DUF808 domain-containing protein [Pleionea sp. CnH1-48]MCO7226405.1 DUF808 domain-containing protein [Pleionea sp. CnH1-48]